MRADEIARREVIRLDTLDQIRRDCGKPGQRAVDRGAAVVGIGRDDHHHHPVARGESLAELVHRTHARRVARQQIRERRVERQVKRDERSRGRDEQRTRDEDRGGPPLDPADVTPRLGHATTASARLRRPVRTTVGSPRCGRHSSSLLAWCAYAIGHVDAHGFGASNSRRISSTV